jgi:hypothetical protein
MAYGLIGNSIIARGNFQSAGNTIIDVNNPAPSRGIMKLWGVYLNNGVANVKVKIFRDDGTNYVFMYESALVSCSVYANIDLPCWIPVEGGDLIGVYCAGEEFECGSTADLLRLKAGDITTTTLKTTWTASVGPLSTEGKIFTRIAPF